MVSDMHKKPRRPSDKSIKQQYCAQPQTLMISTENKVPAILNIQQQEIGVLDLDSKSDEPNEPEPLCQQVEMTIQQEPVKLKKGQIRKIIR